MVTNPIIQNTPTNTQTIPFFYFWWRHCSNQLVFSNLNPTKNSSNPSKNISLSIGFVCNLFCSNKCTSVVCVSHLFSCSWTPIKQHLKNDEPTRKPLWITHNPWFMSVWESKNTKGCYVKDWTIGAIQKDSLELNGSFMNHFSQSKNLCWHNRTVKEWGDQMNQVKTQDVIHELHGLKNKVENDNLDETWMKKDETSLCTVKKECETQERIRNNTKHNKKDKETQKKQRNQSQT